jgi:hypothetical protein
MSGAPFLLNPNGPALAVIVNAWIALKKSKLKFKKMLGSF